MTILTIVFSVTIEIIEAMVTREVLVNIVTLVTIVTIVTTVTIDYSDGTIETIASYVDI